MDARNIHLLLVLGLICTALAKDEGCECKFLRFICPGSAKDEGCECNYQQCICPGSAKDDGCECSWTELAIFTTIGGAVAVGGAAAVPVVLGFTPAGIAPRSFASWLMSISASTNGGGVAPGSIVSILQSVGAGGLSAGAKAGIGSTAATATAVACNALKCLFANN